MLDSAAAKILNALIAQSPLGAMTSTEDTALANTMAAFLHDMPLRGLAAFSGGSLTEESLEALLAQLNGECVPQ